MTKILLRVVGVLVAAGGAVAFWYGFETFQNAARLGQQIVVDTAEMARGKSPDRKEGGEKKIAGLEQEIEAKKTEAYVWFGAGAVALIAGASMVLLPSSRRKRKVVVEPLPAQGPARSADAAGDGGGQ